MANISERAHEQVCLLCGHTYGDHYGSACQALCEQGPANSKGPQFIPADEIFGTSSAWGERGYNLKVPNTPPLLQNKATGESLWAHSQVVQNGYAETQKRHFLVPNYEVNRLFKAGVLIPFSARKDAQKKYVTVRYGADVGLFKPGEIMEVLAEEQEHYRLKPHFVGHKSGAWFEKSRFEVTQPSPGIRAETTSQVSPKPPEYADPSARRDAEHRPQRKYLAIRDRTPFNHFPGMEDWKMSRGAVKHDEYNPPPRPAPHPLQKFR